jgi:hypothetical protein
MGRISSVAVPDFRSDWDILLVESRKKLVVNFRAMSKPLVLRFEANNINVPDSVSGGVWDIWDFGVGDRDSFRKCRDMPCPEPDERFLICFTDDADVTLRARCTVKQ